MCEMAASRSIRWPENAVKMVIGVCSLQALHKFTVKYMHSL